MKHNEVKRKIAAALALLTCLSAPMQYGAAFAEENAEIQQPSPAANAPQDASQPESEPSEPQPEAEAPAETAAPEVVPVPSEAPIITLEPEETPEPETTPTPEATPENGEDASSSDDEQILRNPYSTWYGVTPSDERGMPIPILYQTDYPEVICTIRGIERSVESSGCGATCISMVIAYLTGNTDQNPYIIFCDAVDKGLYTGEGFTHGMISHYAEEYGVNNRWIGKDGDVIIAALEKGIPIIAHMGPGIFTDRGHYVVLRGVTQDGKILLNDPVSPYKTAKAFPLQTILTQCKSSNPFMLCWTDEMEEEVALLNHLHDQQMTMEEIAREIMRPIQSLPHAVEVTTTMVNLRVSPGKGDVVTQLYMGDKVLAVEERIMDSGAFWYGVNYEGRTLYLKSEYIKPIDVAEEELAILQETIIRSTAEPTPAPATESEAEAPADLIVEANSEAENDAEPEPEAISELIIESEPEATLEPSAEPAVESEPETTPEPAVEEEPAPEITSAPTAQNESANEFTPCAAEVTADRVYLRLSPGTGEAAKVLRGGVQIYVVERRFTRSGAAWYGVIFEGEQLYVKGDYIRFIEMDADQLNALKETSMQSEETAEIEIPVVSVQQIDETPATQAVPVTLSRTMDGEFDGTYIAYIGCDSANLRDHIGTRDGLVIFSVPHGTAMYIIGEELCYEDGYVWCKVLFRGRELYVRGDLLQI